MNAGSVDIDVRYLIFPVVTGYESAEGFRRTGFVGTGFFIGRRGLAMTAAHVVSGIASGTQLRVALPQRPVGPLHPYRVTWVVELPRSDLLVMRVNIPDCACFATRFQKLPMGLDVETAAIPETMLETDATGRTEILMRAAKGYISYARAGWIAASFALPKGMSGAPLIVTTDEAQFVAGVFVGQTRGEQIEDLVEEVIETDGGRTVTRVERVDRVEYFARGELLEPYGDYRHAEFGGMTLSELIARDIAPA